MMSSPKYLLLPPKSAKESNGNSKKENLQTIGILGLKRVYIEITNPCLNPNHPNKNKNSISP